MPTFRITRRIVGTKYLVMHHLDWHPNQRVVVYAIAVLCLMLVWSAPGQAQAVLQAEPQLPSSKDSILVRLGKPHGCVPTPPQNYTAQITGSVISIVHTIPEIFIVLLGPCTDSYVLGRLPAGNYRIEWREELGPRSGVFVLLATLDLQVANASPAAIPASGNVSLAVLMVMLLGLTKLRFGSVLNLFTNKRRCRNWIQKLGKDHA